jgi:hypothetical protein
MTDEDLADDEQLSFFDVPASRVPKVRCHDCRIECMPMDTPIGSCDWHRYMVTDKVWFQAGMTPLGGWLCIDCLERRLGRLLHWRDLADLPVNDPDDYGNSEDLPRLAALKRDAARAWGR